MQSRTARIAVAAAVLAATGALTVTFVSGGGKGAADAATNLGQFVPIENVKPNVVNVQAGKDGSKGTFVVDCGTNGNGKFSPDNPVAQPGIKNGAEHVHDFVGNQAITAASSDADLDASGTTCKNGDKSSYFWPVVRIDKTVRSGNDVKEALSQVQPLVACPRVSDRLPAVPAQAKSAVNRRLKEMDRALTAANQQMAASRGRVDADLNNSVLSTLRDRRAAMLKQISSTVVASGGSRPKNLVSLAECDVSYDGVHATLHTNHTTGATTKKVANPQVQCPSVRDKLPGVPQQALAEVDRNLNELDRQISEANERLVSTKGQGGDNFIGNAILGPLKAKRTAVLDRIATSIGRQGQRPQGLDQLAECAVDQQSADAGQQGNGQQGNGQQGNGQQGNGQQGNGQQGNGQQGNGQQGGDQGNQQGGDQGNQQGGDQGNQQGGEQAQPSASAAAELPDPEGPNLELPNNTGGIVRPAAVLIQYRGNPVSKVVPMPKFLRELTGDAKPTSRGPANARATWTCSGFDDRLSDKYPICPAGSQVQRVQDFPGCWDGKNIDSDNHRNHVAFADKETGACPSGFVAIPQLRITLSYDISQNVQKKGQFALDSFPEENHNPFSDHNDFINVNSEKTMQNIANCINKGKNCR